MLFDVPQKPDVSLCVSRQKDLCQVIKKDLQGKDSDLLLLFTGFEDGEESFRQESSFFYMTGLEEPGVVFCAQLSGKKTLFVPRFASDRTKWMNVPVPFVQENAKQFGVDTVAQLGDQCPGYQLCPFFTQDQFKNLIAQLKTVIESGGKVFTLCPDDPCDYFQQRFILERLQIFLPELKNHTVDISEFVTRMRRKKDMQEFQCMYEAVAVTIMAHEAAAEAITPDVSEKEVQGALEYIFTASGSKRAFTSIVAAGKNATVLHCSDSNDVLQDGQLVIVDIGAEVGHYCADLTRTYPVSGKFTKRQRELYEAVLKTQEYVESLAKPGMYLKNEKEPEKSLHHLAKEFLVSKGLGKYFTHGIGHFLGLDVHDVGDFARPLQNGDMFTIEPGVYIPEEGIGIRIEDNYFIGKNELMCLSEELPKDPDLIEKMVQEKSPVE